MHFSTARDQSSGVSFAMVFADTDEQFDPNAFLTYDQLEDVMMAALPGKIKGGEAVRRKLARVLVGEIKAAVEMKAKALSPKCAGGDPEPKDVAKRKETIIKKETVQKDTQKKGIMKKDTQKRAKVHSGKSNWEAFSQKRRQDRQNRREAAAQGAAQGL